MEGREDRAVGDAFASTDVCVFPSVSRAGVDNMDAQTGSGAGRWRVWPITDGVDWVLNSGKGQPGPVISGGLGWPGSSTCAGKHWEGGERARTEKTGYSYLGRRM